MKSRRISTTLTQPWKIGPGYNEKLTTASRACLDATSALPMNRANESAISGKATMTAPLIAICGRAMGKKRGPLQVVEMEFGCYIPDEIGLKVAA